MPDNGKSFCQNVKNELYAQIPNSKHCRVAELSSILEFVGLLKKNTENLPELYIFSENIPLLEKVFTLCHKTFKIPQSCIAYTSSGNFSAKNSAVISGEAAKILLDATGLACDRIPYKKGFYSLIPDTSGAKLPEKECCRRAYLRGAFLSVGTVSDPAKSYHMEFVCGLPQQAAKLTQLLQKAGFEAGTGSRRNKYPVYLKDGASVSELLGYMEAPRSLMDMENSRIVKEVRGQINRRVNCETANIGKTVKAASKQVEDIIWIKEHTGFQGLPENLIQTASLRLQHPEASLTELSELSSPHLGKSGIIHRLRKLSSIAEEMRKGSL